MTKSFDERMHDECQRLGKTSILFQQPKALGVWLYVSNEEVDPVAAFTSGLIDVMISRDNDDANHAVTVRRLSGGMIVPGKEFFFWQLKGDETRPTISGYAPNERDAKQALADAIMDRIK